FFTVFVVASILYALYDVMMVRRWEFTFPVDYTSITNCSRCGCIAMKKQHYIILATPRSGSTMLNYILCQHPDIGCTNEPLHNKLELLPRDLVGDSLDNIMRYLLRSVHKLDCNKVYGFKVFTDHLYEANIPLKDLIRILNKPKIILLYRKNILESFVSMKISQRTQIWNIHLDGPRRNLHLPPQNVTLTWGGYALWRSKIEKRWIEPLKEFNTYPNNMKTMVTYTDLTENRDVVIPKLVKFLGFKPQYFSPMNIKLNPESLEDKIANYGEFMAQLEKHNVSMYLDVAQMLRSIHKTNASKH
ncbi:unnamed protein product, partial [Owenia fusiformis]